MKTISRTIPFALLCLLALCAFVYSIQITSAQAEFDCSTVTDIPPIECEALVAFYNSTNGADWDWWGGWVFGESACSWEGVYCEDGTVSGISTGARGLSGAIPPEISNLTNLTQLTLWENEITSIPPEIGNLTKLQSLYLDGNQLTTVPAELSHLKDLEILDLDDNNLTEVSFEIGELSSLHTLLLSRNKLTDIPSSVNNASTLSRLYLSDNQLTALPSEIGDLTNLYTLDISNNPLTSWPETIVNLDLDEFYVENLCEPDQLTIQTWLDSMVQDVELYPRSHVLCSDAKIAGQLWQYADQEPVSTSGAIVELTGFVGENLITITTQTDEDTPFPDGSFTISSLPLATYTLRVDVNSLCPVSMKAIPVSDLDGIFDSLSTTITISADTPTHLDQNFGYTCEPLTHTFLPLIVGAE